jgi:gliding motility associated protien GldN
MTRTRLLLVMILSVGLSTFGQLGGTISAQPAVRDRAYEVERTENRQVIPYAYLREADVFTEKRIWRVISVQEKMNKSFIYPERKFIDILLDNAYEGVISAYAVEDDKFTTAMTLEQVKAYGRGTDTQLVIDPITLEERYEIFERELNRDNIRSYRLKEDWIFDKQLSTYYVRIMGIAPIESRYDENGNFIADVPMFWFHYPHLRNILVNEEVFNPMNDAQKISWDDLFEMRLFASYIIQESNVYNRRIKDYAGSGIDALLEHDRIRQEMFEQEHDLWSY